MFTDVFYSLVSGFSSYFLPLFLFLDTVTIATSNPNTKQRHSWKLCVRVQVYVCGYVTGSNCLTQPATSTERERGWSRPIRGQNTGMSASGTDVGFMSYLLTSYLYMCFFHLPTWVGKWTWLLTGEMFVSTDRRASHRGSCFSAFQEVTADPVVYGYVQDRWTRKTKIIILLMLLHYIITSKHVILLSFPQTFSTMHSAPSTNCCQAGLGSIPSDIGKDGVHSGQVTSPWHGHIYRWVKHTKGEL